MLNSSVICCKHFQHIIDYFIYFVLIFICFVNLLEKTEGCCVSLLLWFYVKSLEIFLEFFKIGVSLF